jgi:hypothetical protein
MKILITSLLFAINSHAVEISFTGPCALKPIINDDIGAKHETVGDLTVHFLNKKNIPFDGTERGINRVFNTPIGDQALEVISDTEMRAYGWCYFVNGVEAQVFADEYKIDSTVKKIEWIFSYSHYKDGEWLTMCSLTYLLKPKFLCGP